MSQQFRRGSEATRSDYTFLDGEPVWSNDSKGLYVGDGTTAGGIFIGPSTASGDAVVLHSSVTAHAGIGLAGTANISSSYTHSIDIDGLTEELSPADDDFVMAYDTSATTHVKMSRSSFLGASVGESNAAANSGTDGVGVYDQKSGITLEFRHIASSDASLLSVTLDATDDDIDLEVLAAPKLIEPAIKGSVGTISEGEVVYVSGWNVANTVVEIELADADNAAAMPAYGVAIEDIGTGAVGKVLTRGPLDFNTAAYGIGNSLYVSTTPGALTTTRPTAANTQVQKLGYVTRASATGKIEIVGAGRSNDIPNTMLDDRLRIVDSADTSKVAMFDAAAITTATTRTFDFPDSDGTLGLTSRQIASGIGLTGGGDLTADRTLSIDINSLTEELSPANDDFVVAYDTSATTYKKMSRLSFAPAGAGEANTASNLGSGTSVFAQKNSLDLEFRGLTSANAILAFAASGNTVTATVDETAIDHDNLANVVANEHINHSVIDMNSGIGLTGGGDLTADRTFSVDIAGTTEGLTTAATDMFLMYDASATTHVKLSHTTLEAGLNHDALTGFVANEHVDHTSVTMTVTGDANEITVAEGAQDISASRTFTVGIADAPAIPGDYMTVPTKADPDPTMADGRLFYNTTDNRLRFGIDTAVHDVVSPSTTDTLTFKSIDAANNTLTMTESELETAVSDDNPVFDGDFGANGLCARTAAGTYTNRTLTGTTGEISVTNGDGVSGNPTVSLSGMIDTKAFTIGDGTNTIVATADVTAHFFPFAITITDVHSHITGGTNVVFNIGHAATRTGTQLDVFTSDITLTSTAGQTNSSGFNDATIPANSWVWLDLVSVSGAVTMFHGTVEYTRD